MEIAEPLPVAVRKDKSELSAQARQELAALAGRRPVQFLLQVMLAWAVIFGIISWAVWVDSLWATLVAIFIVATRQNILGLLVHEQAHCLGFRAWPGDLIVNLVAAYPLLILTVEGYAQVHLSHHKNYFTDKDPDFLRKSGDEWNFPMSARRFGRILIRDLLGLNLIGLIRGKKMEGAAPVFKRPKPTPGWVRMVYFAIAAAVFTLTGTWDLFLVYWVVPLLTVFQIIVRWGAVCEHQYNRPSASVAETSPIIVLKWWEKLLLPNLNFTLHPYHHYFPGIPFSNLPRAHEIYLREEALDEDSVFHGYAAYLRFLLSSPASVASKHPT